MVKNDYIAFDNGFYPNDWQEDSLGKLCDYVDYRGATPAKKARGIFLITAKNIKKGYIDYSISQEYVAANDYESTMHRGLPKLGDVLITTEAPVGNVAQVDKEKVALAQRIIKYCAHECVVNNTFLKYMLLSYNFQKKLESASTGGTVQGIKGSLLHNLKIVYPKIEEQTAIANVLSDTDALIDSLEKLIAKKQAIKQGAMQELLTGKRRLKGFSGEWTKFSIGSCFDFKNGLNKAKDYFGSGTPIVNYMDVYQKTSLYAKDIRGRVTLSYAEMKRYEVKKGDVFFTRTSETPEEVGIASVLLEDVKNCAFSGFVLRARPKNDILYDKFCKYCFTTVAVREQIISNCTYTTRALTNGNLLSKIMIAVPDKDEQIAITAILDDMDNEISALQKKLDKVRRIKQGMMAELLTGRIRLI